MFKKNLKEGLVTRWSDFPLAMVCQLASHTHVKFWVRVMEFNAIFNNISVISRRSVSLVEETGVSEKTPTCRKSLTNYIT
jgi:lipopolysaccharide biosynthesis protein